MSPFGDKDRPHSRAEQGIKSTQPPIAPRETPSGTSTEAIVRQAPDVVPQLQKVTEQKDADARAAIVMLEQARRTKGNFCVTLGTGEDRAVVLIAPVTGRVHVSPDNGNRETFTDYVAITPHGPRRISFQTGSEHEGPDDKRWLEQGRTDLADFQSVLSRAVQRGDALAEVTYVRWSWPGDMLLTMPIFMGIKPRNLEIHSGYQDNQYAGAYRIAPVRDEGVVEDAVRASLAAVQSPIQTRIGQVRQETSALQGVTKGLIS